MPAQFLQPGVGESDVQAGIAFINGTEQAPELVPDGLRIVRISVPEGVLAATKSGSRAVSLNSSARPEVMRPAQCWSLGCQSPARSGRLKDRTCWRMTSGWKSGLDSRAICLAAGYAATEKSQAQTRCGKVPPWPGSSPVMLQCAPPPMSAFWTLSAPSHKYTHVSSART